MAITVEVDSVDRSLLIDRTTRISWERDVNGQGQARFVLADVPGGFVPDDGMVAIIKEGATIRFEGLINRRPRQFRGPDHADQLTFYDISVGDYALISNKRRVWRKYEEETLEDIVTDLNTDKLDDEGVSLDVTAGTTLITVTFNGESVSECLDILCELEGDGRTWRFEPGKVLTIETLSESAAPDTLDSGTLELDNPRPTIEPDRSVYANRVTVVGGGPDLPIMYTVEDAGEIAARKAVEGGSGIYHYTVEQPDSKTSGEVIAAADGILEKRKVLRQRFTGTTDVAGFEAGQEVTVNLPFLGLNSVTMFIESVRTEITLDASEFHHTVTAITGDPDGGWQSFWRREKRVPKTIAMQIEATPGLVRVEPEPGVLIHDPPPAPTEWFPAAQSGVLDDTPGGISVDHFGRWMLTVRRDGNDTVFEEWAINPSTFVVSTSPTYSTSWVELIAAATFKTTIAAAPYTFGTLRVPQYAAIVHYGAPGKLITVSVGPGPSFLGSVNCTMSAQANGGEPVWVGRYLYWPNVTDGKIFIYDMDDVTTPLEVGSFLTSLSNVFALRVDSAGDYLYAFGTGGVVSMSLADPEVLGPAATSGALTIAVNEPAGTFIRSAGSFEADGFVAGNSFLASGNASAGNNTYFVIDTVVGDTITVTNNGGMVTEAGDGDEEIDAIEDGKLLPTGSYVSGDLSEDDDLIVAGTRIDAANVRITTIDVSGGTLTLNTEKSIALATPAANIMTHAILSHSSFIVWSEYSVSTGANALKAYVFTVVKPAKPRFVETLSYVHAGAAGNLGPVNSQFGRLSVVTFNFNSDAQITWGDIIYDRVVPYEVEQPLRESFGGTGHGGPDDEYLHGDSLWAEDFETLGKLAVGPDGSIVLAAEAETLGVRFANRDFYNGTFLETFDALVTSDGATVTMSLEQSGTGDLTMRFSDGWTELDCDPAPQTIELTAGSDVSPTENFIYVLQSTKELTKNTSDWPATEHIKVAYFLVPSAGFVQTNGTVVNQNWNDHDSSVDDQGHMSHMAERSRRLQATYHSGVDGNGTTEYVTITPGAPDTIHFKSTAGVIYQMHRHAYPAMDTSGGDIILVVNDSVTAYDDITDLADKLLDAAGNSMAGKYYNLVMAGVANKGGEFGPLLCNLPGGSYNKEADALQDVDGHDVFVLPGAFNRESSTGFLVCRITLKHSAAGGGTWTHVATLDLRGLSPATAAGGSTGVTTTEFADNAFIVFDEGDPTKELAFEVSGISAGNTRVLTVPDKDGTIALIATVMSRISMRF